MTSKKSDPSTFHRDLTDDTKTKRVSKISVCSAPDDGNVVRAQRKHINKKQRQKRDRHMRHHEQQVQQVRKMQEFHGSQKNRKYNRERVRSLNTTNPTQINTVSSRNADVWGHFCGALLVFTSLVIYVLIAWGKQIGVNEMAYFVSTYVCQSFLIILFIYFLCQYYFGPVSYEMAFKEAVDIERPSIDAVAGAVEDNGNENRERTRKGSWRKDKLERTSCSKTIYQILMDSLWYVDWTRFTIIVMGTILYYILIILLFLTNNDKKHDQYNQEWLYHSLTWFDLFADPLQAICLHLYSTSKEIFTPIVHNEPRNFAHNLRKILKRRHISNKLHIKHKNDNNNNNNNDNCYIDGHNMDNKSIFSVYTDFSFKPSEHTRTMAGLISFLHSRWYRALIIVVCCAKLVIYIASPISGNSTYFGQSLLIKFDQFTGHSKLMFFWIIVVLRQFSGMIYIISLVILWEMWNGYYIPNSLRNIQFICTPVTCVLLIIFVFVDVYFVLNCHLVSSIDSPTNINSNHGVIYCVYQGLWCLCYSIPALIIWDVMFKIMKLQTDVTRSPYYDGKTKWCRLMEGLGTLGLNFIVVGLMFIHYIVKNEDLWSPRCTINTAHEYTMINKIFIVGRQVLISLVSLGIYVMAYNLSFIVNGRKYEKVAKYEYAFRLVCLMIIYNTAYEISFQSAQFISLYDKYDSIINSNHWINTAFSLSFASIYFNLWALEQFVPWIVSYAPINDLRGSTSRKKDYISGSSHDMQWSLTNFSENQNSNNNNNNNIDNNGMNESLLAKHNDDNQRFTIKEKFKYAGLEQKDMESNSLALTMGSES